MSADQISKWLTIFSNIGVLLGIVFLGFEIQQNTQMVRSQTRDSMTEKQLSWNYFAGSDREKAETFGRGEQNQLEPGAEYFQFLMMASSYFTIMSNEWYQYKQGLYDAEEFQPRLNRWKRQLAQPGFRRVWALVESQHSESFRNEINELIQEVENAN